MDVGEAGREQSFMRAGRVTIATQKNNPGGLQVTYARLVGNTLSFGVPVVPYRQLLSVAGGDDARITIALNVLFCQVLLIWTRL